MPYYTVTEPYGARVTVRAAGPESAKILALHDLGLHPEWPVEVARYPDPPRLSGKVTIRCGFSPSRQKSGAWYRCGGETEAAMYRDCGMRA